MRFRVYVPITGQVCYYVNGVANKAEAVKRVQTGEFDYTKNVEWYWDQDTNTWDVKKSI